MTRFHLAIPSTKQMGRHCGVAYDEAAIRAHAELTCAVQKHDGKVTNRSFHRGIYETRSSGQVYADAEFFVQIIKLTAEFGAPAAVVSFLIYVRPILLKWLEFKKDRSIEIRQGDTSVRIQGHNDIDEALKVFEGLSSKKAPEDDQ